MLFLANHLLVEHISQNQLLAFFIVFGVCAGIVFGGVICDCGNAGRLCKGQVFYLFIEKVRGATRNAAGVANERDRIKVCFKNNLFGVFVLKSNSAENLAHLTHGIVFVITGDVFNQLLVNGGSTLLGIKQSDGTARQLAEHNVHRGRNGSF